MDIIKVFGDNLKKYRKAMGISQEAFADKCGMHRTYISAIECYRRSISLENINHNLCSCNIIFFSVNSVISFFCNIMLNFYSN